MAIFNEYAIIQNGDNYTIVREKTHPEIFTNTKFFNCRGSMPTNLNEKDVVSLILLPNNKIFCAMPNGESKIY